jgi:beta-lactam-binding protein with PASTA domain/predicted Ser/Thr protein kinase
MPDLAPDTLIDSRYKVLTRIGSGGMADVFCAHDEQLGRKVALKLLHARFAQDEEFVERFRREASAAAGLQHPNVVGVYDRGEWDGTYYIAMEYLPGRSLKEVIQQEAPLDPIRAIDLTVQILKAARFAHRRGIVHRDLKPHNVLVDDEDRVKVTDFGIARAGASDMTETGSIMGTAQYLSPEQAQGHAVGETSDLYAVGVILFELLTGHVPFDAESAVTVALKHVSEPPPPPSAFDPAVPPELETIVLWALDKDPAQRPQDADAFIAALEEARDLVLARDAPGQQTTGFAAAPVPFPVGPGVTGAQPATTLDALPPAPVPFPGATGNGGDPNRHRRRTPWWAWLLAALALALVAGGIYLLTRTDEVTVPAVVGQSVQQASARLQDAGLRARVVRATSAKPVDQVIAEDPAGGAHAAKGSTVALTVSRGPGDVTVPAVDGLDQQHATAALAKAGLVVERTTKQSDAAVPAGEAIRTSPAAGASVAKGSGVTLVLSSGPQQVTVPDVVGLSQADAGTALKDQGLQVATTQKPSAGAQPGDVLSQSPAAGAKVDPGATVTLVIAQAPPQVAVPDLTGKTAAQAIDELSKQGFQPRESTRPVTDSSQDNRVLSQSPAPGAKLAKGAPVRIFVGELQTTTTTPGPSTTGAGGEPPAGGGA